MLNNRTVILVMLLAFVCHNTFPSEVRDGAIRVDLYASGGVREGSRGCGGAIDTYFRNDQPLFFVLVITNLSDHTITLGDWQKTLTLEFLHTFQRQEEKNTNITATLVIRNQVEWSKPSGTEKGFLRPAAIPNSAGNLEPHASLRSLMLFEPDHSLPCGDFILSVSMTIQNRRICAGQIFRVREAVGKDDLAKMYKMESIAFGLLGNSKSELERLHQAVKEVPESPWAWYYLGEFYKASGDLQAAKDAFREGAKRFPLSPQKAAERMGQRMPLMEIAQTDGDLLYGEICFEALLAEIERQQSK